MTPAADAEVLGLSDLESFGASVNENPRAVSPGWAISPCSGASVYANPRWVVQSGAGALIGRYSDGQAGFAVKDNGDYRAVFYGGMRMSSQVIRAIAEYAGDSHVFLETDDVSAANDDLLVVHSSLSSIKTLTFPCRCDVHDYFEGRWYANTTSIQVHMRNGETRFFFYGREPDIEAMKLPVW